MDPAVSTVIELQQTDQNLASLTAQRDAVPGRIAAVEAQLNDFLHAYEEHQRGLAANQKARREMEADIQAVREKIARHKDQLYEVKKNDQYKAMLHEIEGEEQNIRKIEDRVLENMEEAEQHAQYVKDAAAKLDGEKARVAAEVKQLQSERHAAEEERNRMEERRRALAASLGESVLALYEKTRKARGFAVAEVREGSCSGCHVRLRPQAYNEVRQSNSLHTCETCGRILYYVEPAAASEDTAKAAVDFRAGTRVQMS
ncbi:MAG TPA: C4-type zinc ribbon domain-containing protein [Terriglobia bacterium]|nr:C4-type zinc ribbon domain-containing protein [Terriglobia bacterium]